MFRRVFRALGSLLSVRSPKFRPLRPPRQQFVRYPPEDTPVDRPDGDRFDSRLASALAAGDQIVAGSLELIGLEDVRKALGSDWMSLAARVIDFAGQEIQRCLDPADIFRQHGDASFVVHFNELDKDAAEQQARRVALRIKSALIEKMPEIAQAISIRHFVADIDPTSLQGEDGKSLADALFERLILLRAEAERSVQRDRKSLVKDFQILFSPVWHARRQVILLNRCLIDTAYSGTSLSQFQELADPDEMAATYAELDYVTLTKALEALHRMINAGRKAMLLLSVDFRTISNATTAAAYVRLVEAVPEAYKKFIILEIAGVAGSFRASRLGQLARLLGRYVRYVAVELALDDARLGAVAAEGIWAITINLTGADPTDPRLAMQLRNCAQAAATSGVNTMARGANSIGLALAAADAGCTYVDGPGIHLPVREPKVPGQLRPLPRPASQGRPTIAIH